MKKKILHRAIFFCSLIFLLFSTIYAARIYAAPAPELPDDNLIVNPWFRDSSNTGGSHDGWIPDEVWGLSQKNHNPTPDDIQGTSVRLGIPKATFGVDSFVHTIVPADSENQILRFQTWQVSRNLHEEYVIIYGSDSEDGPWTQLWQPWIETNSSVHWMQIPLLEKQLEKGFPFYKVEFMCNYGSGTAGCKYTGVYFTASDISDPNAAGETARPESGSNGRGEVAGAAANSNRNEFDLTATAVSESEIMLSWDETFVDGTELFIERSADGRRDWKQLGMIDLQENSHSDSELEGGTAYFYRLQGQGEDNGRLRSIVTSATTLSAILLTPTAAATVTTMPTAAVTATAAEPIAELPTIMPEPVEPEVAPDTQMPENEVQVAEQPVWAGSLLGFFAGMLLMGLIAWVMKLRKNRDRKS